MIMRVLTTQEFIENRIPRKEDFKAALNQFEQDCVLPFLGEGVVGAFAYGSVNRDDCSLSSDIDYFMIITDDNHTSRVREATRKAIEERNIDIQTRVIRKKFAMSGDHGIDLSFKEHLGLSVERYGYKGLNPLEVIVDRKITFEEALRNSASAYITKMTNEYTNYPSSEEGHLKLLKSILEKPFHAMRIAIQYHFGTVAPDGKDSFHDTKDNLMNLYKRFGSDESIQDIQRLKMIAKEYNQLLEQRQRGKIPPNELESRYENMLIKIITNYSTAYRFIEFNAERMMR